jgi:nickel-dependent lactate racemase
MDPRQIAWKVGADVRDHYRVEVHDASQQLAPTGIEYGSAELKLNRTFMEADVKLGVGAVLPHAFAGFSGGAKLMVPGLADAQATARSHRFVQMGLRGGQDVNENKFRLEIEGFARRIGFCYAVCVVPNARRETAGVVAGDLVAAHRHACHVAARVYATPLRDTYDCAVLNAYPKDTDLIQAENVFVALGTAHRPIVHDEGILIITTAATEGLGTHGLFAPGGLSYRRPQKKRALGNREIWLYAPSISESTARKLYWEGYSFFRTSAELTRALSRRLPTRARAAVLPCAPLQQIDDQRRS